MKPETKQKLKKVAKICTGVAVGALALLGVISLGGMVKSCSQGEITPVVTTPVVTSVTSVSKIANPKNLPAVSGNIDHTSPFGSANKWAEFTLQTSYRGVAEGEQDEGDIISFAVLYQGRYYQINEAEIVQEPVDSYTTNLVYYINNRDIKMAEIEIGIQDSSVESATWYCQGFYTLPQYVGNYPNGDVWLLDSLGYNGLVASTTPIGEFENPVYLPHSTWTVNYSNTGGYWVDNVTGGVVTQMTNGQTYDLVWVSVQGYLYPSDVQAEEHTSSDGGTGIFSTKDGRVHMEFMAADPALLDRITIATNLSSLAIPNGGTIGDDQVNTASGLSNSFALLGSAFSSMAGLLSMEVFPGLSLSALLFVPVVVAVILFILKAIGK